MAENKSSFIMYCDWQEMFEELTDEEAGQLIKHTFRYVNDENPIAPDKYIKRYFIPIKQTLKRDLVKYETYIIKQRVNGAKGGRPKKTQITQPLIEKPKKADSVSVSDNVNDSVREIPPAPISDTLRSIQSLKDELINSEWLNIINMQYKPKVKPEAFKKIFNNFCRDQYLGKSELRQIGDFRSHFINTIKAK